MKVEKTYLRVSDVGRYKDVMHAIFHVLRRAEMHPWRLFTVNYERFARYLVVEISQTIDVQMRQDHCVGGCLCLKASAVNPLLDHWRSIRPARRTSHVILKDGWPKYAYNPTLTSYTGVTYDRFETRTQARYFAPSCGEQCIEAIAATTRVDGPRTVPRLCRRKRPRRPRAMQEVSQAAERAETRKMSHAIYRS